MSSHDLDALVAIHVMGWTPATSPATSRDPECWITNDRHQSIIRRKHWRPSDDIAQAFQVIEAMRSQGWSFACGDHLDGTNDADALGAIGPWWCEFLRGEDGGSAYGDALPRVIGDAALTALKASGVEV